MKGRTHLLPDVGESGRICVAVRFRPLSEKEIQRGDTEVWRCLGNSVGVVAEMGMDTKFAYDHVFPGDFSNEGVYNTVASSIVKSSLDGINGTIFAYGVTSSGKTHTMMGDDQTPGIVPHALSELFHMVGMMSKKKEFVLKLSMLEIYNEVVNDLLDPSNANLRLREDSRRGVYVEKLAEERLSSAEQALQVVANGNEQRKVGATRFNEGSSRSHTVIKVSIEASDRPEFLSEPDVKVGRTISSLTMVDLAGSESAKAEVDKSQRVEGSFINKSLLTLGTVIHKLSDGGAAHIPFRDSKLTRILSNSLTGNGARIAVICTITPASTQAEETHNTLKFASRAKKITIEAKRNEILDQSAIIKRYQQENDNLRRQLEIALKQGGRDLEGIDEVNGVNAYEILALKEKVEEEHTLVVEGEQERLRLLQRVEELTEALLNCNSAVEMMNARLDGSAGDSEVEKENKKLRDALQVLSNEIRRIKEGRSSNDSVDDDDTEISLQAFYAEREFLNEKLEQLDGLNSSLLTALEKLGQMVAKVHGLDVKELDVEGILAGDFSSVGDFSDSTVDVNESSNTSRSLGMDPKLLEDVLELEKKVLQAVAAVQKREEKVAREHKIQKTINGLNDEVEHHVASLTHENHNLREELRRVEAQNEQLLGYSVDHLSESELLSLIGDLTSAVDRVRLTVQTKNIGMKARPNRSKRVELPSPEQRASGGRMSMEYMSKVIEDLKQHCKMQETRRTKRAVKQ